MSDFLNQSGWNHLLALLTDLLFSFFLYSKTADILRSWIYLRENRLHFGTNYHPNTPEYTQGADHGSFKQPVVVRHFSLSNSGRHCTDWVAGRKWGGQSVWVDHLRPGRWRIRTFETTSAGSSIVCTVGQCSEFRDNSALEWPLASRTAATTKNIAYLPLKFSY